MKRPDPEPEPIAVEPTPEPEPVYGLAGARPGANAQPAADPAKDKE